MTFTAVTPGTATLTASAAATALGRYGLAVYGAGQYGGKGITYTAKTAGTLAFTAA